MRFFNYTNNIICILSKILHISMNHNLKLKIIFIYLIISFFLFFHYIILRVLLD